LVRVVALLALIGAFLATAEFTGTDRTAAHDRKPWAMTSEIFVYLSPHSFYSYLLFIIFSTLFIYHCLAPVNGKLGHN